MVGESLKQIGKRRVAMAGRPCICRDASGATDTAPLKPDTDAFSRPEACDRKMHAGQTQLHNIQSFFN
jgi:hypothetical protein